MVLICRVKAIQIEVTKEKDEKNIVDGLWKKRYQKEKERNIYLRDELRKCEEELRKWRRGRQFIIVIMMWLIIAVMHTTYPVVKLKPEKIHQSYLYIFRYHSPQSNIWNFIYSLELFSFDGNIPNSLSGQLSDGCYAHLVEHCTSIAEVMDSIPIQAWNFF